MSFRDQTLDESFTDGGGNECTVCVLVCEESRFDANISCASFCILSIGEKSHCIKQERGR